MNRIAILVLVFTAIPPAHAADTDFFEKKIRPVLVKDCYSCHSAEAAQKGKLKGGLLLDTAEATLKGGESGPAVVPGKPKEGTLLKALHFGDELRMPPKGKLSDAVIKDFTTWIESGAVDPRKGGKAVAAAPAGIDIEAARQQWAYQTPNIQPPPAIQNTAWPQKSIDRFVLAKLEAAGSKPNPPADPRTLIRRVTFDLTGLPPTPKEVEAFVKDPSLEKAVDRLLSTKAYGERWARVWLDVARFAEDQAHIVGSDASLTYPNAYLYRDWVIDALNRDLPYSRFIQLQLAADLFEGESSPNIAALGFLGLGPKYYRRNALEVMADEWEDRVDVISRGLLGLTVVCARCHDHKFDPIRTSDYYALAGVFASTKMYNRPLTSDMPKKDLKDDGEAKLPKEAMHIVREGKPTDLTVFIRGDVENKGPLAPRRFLAVLCEGEPKSLQHGSGRRDLANAIVDPQNPLTARVFVNRIWAAYFGRGIVSTASNFGSLGDKPTHPELLDDLAARFMKNGWSLKWLQKEIVLSATYQQASATRAEDPENRLLGRMPRRRLSVEAWRDAVLASSGKLDTSSTGGKSIDPIDPKQTRRTIYSEVSRLELNKLLAMFDFPDPNVTAERRTETITPLQKLFTLNSPWMINAATSLSQRVAKEVHDPSSDGHKKQIQRMYRLMFARPASPEELKLGLEFIANGDDLDQRWAEYAQILLASNEMLYVD